MAKLKWKDLGVAAHGLKAKYLWKEWLATRFFRQILKLQIRAHNQVKQLRSKLSPIRFVKYIRIFLCSQRWDIKLGDFTLRRSFQAVLNSLNGDGSSGWLRGLARLWDLSLTSSNGVMEVRHLSKAYRCTIFEKLFLEKEKNHVPRGNTRKRNWSIRILLSPIQMIPTASHCPNIISMLTYCWLTNR